MSTIEDPEIRVARALQRHVEQTLAVTCLVLAVASCIVLGGNVGLWLLGRELHMDAIPVPAILLPFSAVGWLLAQRSKLSRVVQHVWFLVGATIPTVALLVNLRRDPLEAVQAADMTIWLYPFCIVATVLTLDRRLSHWTAIWCAVQYAVIHGLAVSQVGSVPPADGLVRVVAILLVGFAAGHANYLARETIGKLVDEEQRSQEARERGKTAAAFLARMSHELKTPLHIILGNAELLLAREHLEAEPRKQVEAARLSGRHLLGLVEALLDQGRLSSGHSLALSPRPIELDPLLAQIETMLREPAVARGLVLRIERDSTAPNKIYADPLRLRQVLLNLMDNGLKYTDRGEVGLRVSAGDPGELRFEVHDTGPGISTEDQEQLFEPFYRGATATEGSSGVGLGLSIAKALVTAMGGRLELFSDLGKGSRFLVTLPGAEDEPIEAAPERTDTAALDRIVVPLPEALRANLLHWAERGNMTELRRSALEAAARDPSLAPLCEQLCAAADAFDDAACLRLLQRDSTRL